MAATMVNGSSIATADCLIVSPMIFSDLLSFSLSESLARFLLTGLTRFSRPLSSSTKSFLSDPAIRFSHSLARSRRASLLKQQLPRSARSLHHRLNQRNPELPFLQLENSIDRAPGRCRHGILQQRWVVACLQHHAGRAL